MSARPRRRAALGVAAAALAAAIPAIASAAPGYELEVAERAEATAGEPAAISLSLAPEAGRSISRDGPIRIELRAKSGLTLPRRRYRRAHAADPRARAPRFDLRFRAPEPGTFELSIEVAFWVCRRRTCTPVKEERVVTVSAGAAE